MTRICGKRLRPLVPILVSAMERNGHLQWAPEVLTGLLRELRKLLPFPLLGFHTDNDSVFMNETVRNCAQAGVEFTRSRPYRKTDRKRTVSPP